MQENKWKRKVSMFLGGQAISLLGSALVQYAIVWYVTLETNSGAMVTLLTLCSFVPQLVISLFAGVWADRFNRKVLIMLADGGIALSTLGLIFIILGSEDYYWALLLVSAIRSAGAGIQTPAVNAVIPQLVPQNQLMRVSGINGSIQSLVGIVAPAVAGALLSLGSITNVLFIDILTAAVGIGILFFIRIPLHERAKRKLKGGYLDDFKTGLKYSFGNQFLRRLLIVGAVTCLVISPALFLNVLFVTRTFGNSYYFLTLNEIGYFIGAIAGGVLISTWGGYKNRLKTLVLGCCVFALTIIGAGVAQRFWVYLIMMAACGLATPFVNSPLMVLVQEKADPDMQGRVFSLVQIMMTSVMPLSLVVFGPLADVINIRWIMVGSGLLMFPILAVALKLKGFYKSGYTAVE